MKDKNRKWRIYNYRIFLIYDAENWWGFYSVQAYKWEKQDNGKIDDTFRFTYRPCKESRLRIFCQVAPWPTTVISHYIMMLKCLLVVMWHSKSLRPPVEIELKGSFE